MCPEDEWVRLKQRMRYLFRIRFRTLMACTGVGVLSPHAAGLTIDGILTNRVNLKHLRKHITLDLFGKSFNT